MSKREVKDDSKILGLSNWKDTKLLLNRVGKTIHKSALKYSSRLLYLN